MQQEYSFLIKVLLYHNSLVESMSDGHVLSYEELVVYAMTRYDYLKEQNSSQYKMVRNFCSQVLELSPESNIGQELQRLIDIWLTMRTNLYRLKVKLAEKAEMWLVMKKIGYRIYSLQMPEILYIPVHCIQSPFWTK